MKTKLFEVTYKISSPMNEKIALDSIKAQLSHQIFNELINKEKESLTATIIIEIEEEDSED